MHPLDLVIVGLYLVGTVTFGAWFARSQRTVRDFFVTGQRVPWWAVTGSIVATETSTVTFISVPGFAFANGFTFMQLVMGYMVGRVVVALLFVPAYFRGELLTVYQLLGERFGTGVKRLAAVLFLATRTLADGFRLFATGLVLAALLLSDAGVTARVGTLLPGLDPNIAALVISILVIGIATIAYTYLGGMEAVIWTDVVQLIVYVAGATLALLVLVGQMPGGWHGGLAAAAEAGRLRWFDFTVDITRSYTFWSGLIGGAFLTTATHGTDQMMVQRYLCSASTRHARLALLSSGAVVFAQFMLFLLIGALLYVFYTDHAAEAAARFTVGGRLQTDRIFPTFIVEHLPVGVVGLIVAAIFAAAMSTLSSSLNSSAATTIADFYVPLTRGRRAGTHYLQVSRVATAVWGLLQVGVALVAIRLSSRVVDEVLGIASFTNGVILGVFLLGTFTQRAGQRSAFVGIVVGAMTMLGVKAFTAVSWQWYVLIGSLTTWSVAALAARAGLDDGTVRPSGQDA